MATIALVVGALVAPSSPAGAAVATVGNGITTTDLNAPGTNANSLASALVGPGVTVSNVTFSGDNAQGGLLHVVDPAVVSFNDGIIMSSGNVADVVGPNKSDGITGDMAGPADADLNALIADTQTVYPMTFDAASLEFDFVPTASQVYFTYTFGSDEYLEWVNLFNDVFAFYVNGQNCATVPNGAPVTIDTINDNANAGLFRDNSFSNPPANPINIESDGLSVEMICTANVTPGQTNHMKIAIADTSDQILDSVVMLKAHSFSTTKPEACNDHHDNDDDSLVDELDDDCSSTTTPPPVGSEGIGSSGKTPPFTGNEGSPIPLDGEALNWHASTDTLYTQWTVTGINGTTGSCAVSPAGFQPILPDRVIAQATAICPDEGEYVAMVEGWDAEGSSAFDKDVDFFVHNAPPAVTIDAPQLNTQVSQGAPLSVSATVVDPGTSDAVDCSISWGDGTSEPGDLVGDTCSGTHTYDDLGSPILSFTAGDSGGASAAAATMLSVVNADTTVSSDANPSVSGQPVTLTAETTLGTTGTVKFYDGATLLATRYVAGGTATFTTTRLGVGSHAITASYKKTSTSVASVSAPLAQEVAPAATTTALTSSANPTVTGQLVAIKATVAPQAPGTGLATGTVNFYDNGNLVASKSVSKGIATANLRPGLGTHSYTADYSGSVTLEGSATTATLDQVVEPAATTTALSSTVNPAVFGQYSMVRVLVRAAVPASGVPAGAVSLYDDGNLVATKTLTNGAATFPFKAAVGVHGLTASYSGTEAYLPSSATTPFTQTVNQAASKVLLSSSAATTTHGHAGWVTGVVRAVTPGVGSPTGSVTLYDDGALIGTYPIQSGLVRLPIASLAVGVHPITATYSGDANFTPSATTTPFVQTIT